jgi:cysteine synthase
LKPKLKCPWTNIGNTRLVKITDRLYAKMETENPTGSIKDRTIQYIISAALVKGEIGNNTTLVEASSGNTGISVSAIGASLDLSVKIVMPSNMSRERRQMMKLFGAEIIDAPPSDFKAAIQIRNDLVRENEGFWSPMQFENLLNIECHKETTAKEILNQIPPFENISAFFSGAGTGGTIMGVREAFVEKGLFAKCMLVIPFEDAEEHGIQGIGDGGDYLADRSLLSGVYAVKTAEAKERARQFALEYGVLVGISSGANLLAAERYIREEDPEGVVVTTLCDRGERYLSLL